MVESESFWNISKALVTSSKIFGFNEILLLLPHADADRILLDLSVGEVRLARVVVFISYLHDLFFFFQLCRTHLKNIFKLVLTIGIS